MVCQLRDFENERYSCMRVGDITQLIECLPSTHKDLSSIPRAEKPGLMLHTCNPSIPQVETGGSEAPGHH